MKAYQKKIMKPQFLPHIVGIALILGFAACSGNDPDPNPNTPSVEITFVNSTESTVTVLITPKKAEACFIDYVKKGETEPSAAEILASGKEFSTTGGNYMIEGLTPETTYVVLSAARNGEQTASSRLEVQTRAENSGAPIELNRLLKAEYSTGTNSKFGNYELVIGNTETLERDGDVQMVLDLYNEPDANPLNAIIPNGVYSPSSDGATFTYNPPCTCISFVANGEVVSSPVMGAITVERQGDEYTIQVEGILLTDQTDIKVLYKGCIPFEESQTSDWVPFEIARDITFEVSQGRYWGNWFYPFSDDLGVELFQGEFDENGSLLKGYYFHLTKLYMPKLENYNARDIELANGEYFITPDRATYVNTYALPYTFDRGKTSSLYDQIILQGSYVTYVDQDLNIKKVGIIAEGSIVVSGSGASKTLEFDLKTEEGISIKGRYNGDLNLSNYNDNDQNEIWSSRPWSSLTSNHIYNWKPETRGHAFLLGDYIKEGLDTWMVMIGAKDSSGKDYGDYFTTELLVDSSNGFEFPTGTFSVDWNLQTNTMLPGFVDFSGGVLFTYYGDLTLDDEGYSAASAPISSGTVTISKESNEYKFVFAMTDDAGNKVTGEWKGAITLEDLSDGNESRNENLNHVQPIKLHLYTRR